MPELTLERTTEVRTNSGSAPVREPGAALTPSQDRSRLQADVATEVSSGADLRGTAAALRTLARQHAQLALDRRVNEEVIQEQLREMLEKVPPEEREVLLRETYQATLRVELERATSAESEQSAAAVAVARVELEKLADVHAKAFAWGELTKEQRDAEIEKVCKGLPPEQREKLMKEVYGKTFEAKYEAHRGEMWWYEKAYADTKAFFSNAADFVKDAVSSVKNFVTNLPETVGKIVENGKKILSVVSTALSKISLENVVDAAKWVGGKVVDLTVSAVTRVAEATGIPSLARAGWAVLHGDFGKAWSELKNGIAAPFNAVIGLGKMVVNTAEALGVGEIVRGVGCLVTGDFKGALQAVKGAWTMFTETTGLADAYQAVSFGVQAFHAAFIVGDFKKAAILGAQMAMHATFAAMSAGSIAATVATAGAAAPTLLAVIGLRQAGKTMAKEAVETGLKTVMKESLQQLGKSIGKELLETGLEKQALVAGRELGQSVMKEIAEKVVGKELSKETAQQIAKEIAERQTREAVEVLVKKPLAEVTEKLLSKKGIDETLQKLVKEGLVEKGVATDMRQLIRQGGGELAEKQLREMLEKGVRETIEKPLHAAMKTGFDESLERGLKDLAKKGVKADVREGVEAGAKEGFEKGFKEGLEKAIKEGIEQGLKAARHGKFRYGSRHSGERAERDADEDPELRKALDEICKKRGWDPKRGPEQIAPRREEHSMRWVEKRNAEGVIVGGEWRGD